MKKKFFYGWIVAICCTLLAFSVNAMGNNTLSFYVAPISEDFGINRAAMNFALFTVGLFTRTICGFFFGKITGRFGIKRMMVFSLILVLAGYAAYAFADNIFMIGLGAALYGVAHALGTLSSYNVIINNWFIKRKGLVLGMLNTAVGVGGMVINPLIGYWITQYGWNRSFFNTALVIAAIAIPSLILIKESPKPMGLVPYGMSSDEARSPSTERLELKDDPSALTFRRALSTRRFWLLVAMQLLMGFSTGPCFSNAIPAFYATGADPRFVAGVLAVLIAFGATIGNITSGLLYDKFGLVPLMTVALGVVGCGMICMGFLDAASPAALFILTVLCIGYGNALSLGTLSHTINNVFVERNKDFSVLFGCLFSIQNIGSMLGSPISGMIFDRTGSYQSAYWISAVLLILMYIVLRVALKSGEKFKQASTVRQ